MEENLTYTGTTTFKLTNLNTSCTGGTITELYNSCSEEDSESKSYMLTINELRSCRGFEDTNQEEAEVIIQTLYQFSALCYQAIINDRPAKI